MNNSIQVLQIIYEISISIGKSLDINEMLRSALLAYLKKLNCTAGIIYQTKSNGTANLYNEELFKMPLTLNIKDNYTKISEVITSRSEGLGPEQMLGLGQVKSSQAGSFDNYYHIFKLENFGFLVLIKRKNYLNEDIINALYEINEKLALACMACINNEALIESQNKYKSLIESLPEMICETDIDGFLTYANEYALTKMGYTKEDLSNKFHVLNLFHPDEHNLIKDKFQEALKSDNRSPNEYCAVTKEGTILSVIVYTNRLIKDKKVEGLRGVMIDITARKESEKRLQALSESTFEAIFFSDKGVCVNLNETAKQMFGYTLAESIGKPATDWIHPDYRGIVIDNIKSGIETPYEAVALRKDGTTFPCEIQGKMTVVDGKPLRITALRDVSERMKNKEALTESERKLSQYTERLELALLGSEAGLWDWNILTGEVYFSERWCEMLGYKQDEVEHNVSFWEKIVHKDDMEWVTRELNAHLEGKTEVYKTEHRVFTKDENWIWILDTGKVTQRDENGKPIRAVGTHIDISDKKDSERKLMENLNQQELLSEIALEFSTLDTFEKQINSILKKIGKHIKTSRIYIFEENIAKEKSHTYIWYDQKIKEERKNLQSISVELIEPIKEKVRKNGITYSDDVNNPDEEIYHILARNNIKSIIAYPLYIQGELFGFICFDECFIPRMWSRNELELIRTISGIVSNAFERKRMEFSIIEERDKANVANKAKSEFLANMSHEIRTPMNAVLGFSEALFHKLDDQEHKQMIKSILNSGNLLMSLLNDILDLSKIEAGKLEILQQPTTLWYVLNEIKLLFNETARKKNVNIEIQVNDDFPDSIKLDEIRIKQIIFNLVGNAVKFTHKGYIHIQMHFVMQCSRTGTLEIRVEDTGIGIAKADQQYIFESFRQQSGQSNRKYEGIGLGLAITKRLVEKMNGEILLDSKPDHGSVFTVRIPDVEVCENQILTRYNVEEVKNVKFDPATVLIVDDVHSNIKAVESLLQSSGLILNYADSGGMALELIKHNKPNLILLDLRMPDLDGFEVAKWIKENPDTSDITLIAYTASVFSAERIESYGYFCDVIFKPVNRNELYSVLIKQLPYSIDQTKNTDTNIEEEKLIDIPEQLKKKLPELEKTLKEDLLQNKWELIKDQLILFKIEEFAVELKKIAMKYEFQYLSDYAEHILESIDQLDLNAISLIVADYPKIVEQITNYNRI